MNEVNGVPYDFFLGKNPYPPALKISLQIDESIMETNTVIGVIEFSNKT